MAKKLATTMHMYNWFFKLIAAALLIGLGIILLVSEVEHVLEALIGIMIAVYAIVRLVPFVRSQKNDLIQTINIIEITLNVLIAAIFIIVPLVQGESLGVLFGYMFAGVLLVRGMVHFYGLSNGAETGDHLTYFFHIATLIVGTFIIARGFETTDLLIFLAILAFLSSGYLGVESYSGYNRYRKYKQLEESKEDKPEDEVPKGIDAPSKKDEDRPRKEIVS